MLQRLLSDTTLSSRTGGILDPTRFCVTSECTFILLYTAILKPDLQNTVSNFGSVATIFDTKIAI